ncbi:MAG: glycosyltransferase family 2 protein [Pyrinomonadaceae bacterium]
MKPLVSVIIPNYNYAQYLREAIDSVLRQTYENIEIIVVDDGSKDESKEVLQSCGDKIETVFQQNLGVSAARNNGVRKSVGEFIALLDADDMWLPEKIERQIQKFTENSEIGLVHVGVEEFDDAGNILKTRLNGMAGEVSHELLLSKNAVILGGGSGMMIPRKVFEEVEGFDLRLLTSADWDLFYRVSRSYKVGFVNEVLLRYRIHGSNMHGNVARMEREMLFGYEKAFSEKDTAVQEIRRTAYGNLHQVLAGSYFNSGQYADFVKHAFKSIWLTPRNFSHFAAFPLRRLKRRLE